MSVDVVLDARATLAEGPIWDEHAGCLRWVDIPAGLVHRFDPATGVDTAFDAGEPVGAVAARRGGGLVLATASGIVTCAEDGTRRQTRHVVDMPPGGRFNDGKADRWGRFWAGTLVAGVREAGALYRLDPDGTLHTMLTGVSVSNGLGWSPDGRTMYYADSPTGGVDAFDHDQATGEITNRRRVVDVDRGRPDGLTVDAEGTLWVALWEGGAVRRYAPDGRLLRTVPVPARRVTSCAFGGSTLYITTAGKGLSDVELADQPHAGGIFALDAGVPGQRTGEWFG